MSEIRVTTISDTAGTGPVTLTKQHAVKAWLVGTTSAGLTDSFNFSSGTDDGTGQYNYSFTNNMGNATWCASGLVEVVARIFTLDNGSHSKTADKVYVRVVTHADVSEDRSHCLSINGDLA